MEAGRTSISGSHAPVGSGGMPQSSTPGIGGGRSSARIRVISSVGSRPVSCVSIMNTGASCGGVAFVLMLGACCSSSARRARGWIFAWVGLRMTTWLLAVPTIVVC